MATRWKIRASRQADTKSILLGLVTMTSLTVIALLVIRIEGEQTRQTIREVAQTTNVDVSRVAQASVNEMSQVAQAAARDAVRAGVDEATVIAKSLPKKMLGALIPGNGGESKTYATSNAKAKQAKATTERNEPALNETADQAEEIIADAFQLGRKMTAAVNDAAQRALKSTADDE